MSDLSSEDFEYSPPRPVVMISKPPTQGIESSDEGELIDCDKDTSNEELVQVDPKVKKCVPPLLARPVNRENTKIQPKLQRPIRHPDGSPLGHTLPSKSAPKPTSFSHSAKSAPTPKSNKSQSSTTTKPTRPAPLPKASVISFNMEDNLTITSVKDLPMKPTQHQLSSPDQNLVVGKLKEEIVFLGAASGPGQSWLFPADFWPILGYFGLFKTESWLSPVDISSYRHSLSDSGSKVRALSCIYILLLILTPCRKRDAEVIEHLRNQNQFLTRKVRDAFL